MLQKIAPPGQGWSDQFSGLLELLSKNSFGFLECDLLFNNPYYIPFTILRSHLKNVNARYEFTYRN